MNCCSDYGECKQGFGCPARCTPAIPKPEQCVKAGMCQSESAVCHCAEADKPEPLYARIGFWFGVMAVITFVWAACLLWVAYTVATGPAVAAIQEWFASVVRVIVSNFPLTPIF